MAERLYFIVLDCTGVPIKVARKCTCLCTLLVWITVHNISVVCLRNRGDIILKDYTIVMINVSHDQKKGSCSGVICIPDLLKPDFHLFKR